MHKLPSLASRRSRCAAALAALCVVGPSLRASAQDPHVRTLASVGQVLPNGDTVLSFFDQAISNDGAWLARAVGDTGSIRRESLIVNGVPLFTEGDVLADGSVLASIEAAFLSPDGSAACWCRVKHPGAPTRTLDRIALSDTILLQQGQPVLIPALGIFGLVRGISGFTWRGDRAYVSFSYHAASGVIRRALVDFQLVGSDLIGVAGLVSGALMPGTSAKFFDGSSSLAMIEGGVTGGRVTLEEAGIRREAIEVDGAIVAEQRRPGPLPGSTWAGFRASHVSVHANGAYAHSAELVTSPGISERVLVRDGTLWRRVGDIIGGSVSRTILDVGNITRLTTPGEVVYVVRLAGGWVIAAEQEVVLAPGSPVADGDRVRSISACLPPQAVSPDGRLVLAVAELSGAGYGLQLIERRNSEPTGCLANVNSTGAAGSLAVNGSRFIEANDLTVTASGLPLHATGYLLAARAGGFVANPAGSYGNLCLSGPVGRFPMQAQSSGTAGSISSVVDLLALPQPSGTVEAVAGERWHFQLWHRDTDGGTAASNFTDSIATTFL